ncbi:unnamed protein product [Scytosiphon promiscuus]
MPLHPDDDNVPPQPLAHVDDLRRSGRLAIWPYIMRELPLLPVEELRMELQLSIGCEVSPRPPRLATAGVEYFPSCLPGDGDNARSEQRPTTTGPDPAVLHKNSFQTRRQEQEPSEAGGGVPHLLHSDRAVVSSGQEADSYSSPEFSGRQVRRLASDPPHRLSSCGQGRYPPRGPPGKTPSPFLSHDMGDRVECPSGCGDEVRVADLNHHQESLCALRYVGCLMPGCSTLVQARLLRMHLTKDCSQRREQHIRAEQGKMLDGEVDCDACGERTTRKYLRTHIATTCKMRMVQCNNCKEMILSRSLADHRQQNCETAKRSRALLDRAARRSTEEECPACHKMVATGAMRNHTLDQCPSRIVACRNRYLGCEEELTVGEMATHIREHCVVRIERTKRAAKHLFRRRRVQCSGCGYSVILQDIQRHEREKCPNRRVPCKHWELGCPATLRLSAMDEHLKVDRLLDPRACLAFDSGRAFIALGEGDRKPPWTAEVWIWRPGQVEATREKARTALKALWDLQVARGKLAMTERRLGLLEPLLIDVATRAAKEQSEDAERARDKLTDEMIAAATVRDDAKVDLVVSCIVLSNSVASAVRGVEDITAQEKLHGFDRLALGSSSWYASVPDRAGSGLNRDERGARSVSPTLTLDCPPTPALAALQRSTMDESQGVQGEENASHDARANDDRCAEGSSANLSEGAEKRSGEVGWPSMRGADAIIADDTVVSSKDRAEVDLDGLLSAIAKEQQALQVAEETSRRKKEAEFWGEWVALNGPSLARRFLALAGKTLPCLKEEVVTITGLPRELLFRSSDEPTDDATDRTMEGDSKDEGGDKPHASIASNRRGRKQKHEENFGKSIEARIAEEVGKRGGIETLFGSDKALFQLEMGPKGRIGIKVAGKKDQIFNYRCPRERWVHLAFVSDATGVFLLENGKTASRLRDVSVALPMREIGGRETACQCLVQEVRYWKVKRSKEEVVEWMHQVLPGTSTKDGLIGYWTFEEGRGDYVNDVTEQRFRARKVGGGLKWAVPENMSAVDVGAPPTPSWREQNVCKVELRRGRLAKRGRLHRQNHAFTTHFPHTCRHLDQDCAVYGTWLRMAEAGQELQESCSCPHCGEIVRRSQLKLHLEHLCHWFKEKCRNAGCAAAIPRLRRAEHERRFCGAPGAVQRRRRLARARARSSYVRDWSQDGE